MIFDNIRVFEMYLNGTWTSIKNNIDSDTGLLINPHNDGTFMVGTFDMWSSVETYPPYIPVRFTYNSNNNYIYLVAKDNSKRYLFIEGGFHHSFDLYEATALLSNFIIGTKTLSLRGRYTNDYASIHILLQLMQNKYGVLFNYSNYTASRFNKKREFTFGPGTTLYTALCTIMEEYDFVPIITTITSNTSFTLSIIDRNTSTTISYLESELTDVTFNQELDDYCKYLECEANNVVDRTNKTTWFDITARSEDILINADTCCLLLPSKVETIHHIWTNYTSWVIKLYLALSDVSPALDSYLNQGYLSLDEMMYACASYAQDATEEEIEDAKESTVPFLLFKATLVEGTGYSWTNSQIRSQFDDLSFSISYNATTSFYTVTASAQISSDVKMDVTERLLEKSVWDTLDVTEKPKYMYYESGTNVIKGLYEYYNDSFWGTITGQRSEPWYNHVSDRIMPNVATVSHSTSDITLEISPDFNYDPMNASFDIEATVITDPIIINEKSISPLNESAWKPYARSYDNKAKVIEYDKLEERMQISNNMLGDVELKIELTNPTTIPPIRTYNSLKMTYNNVPYYVLSYVAHFTMDNLVITYNLSRTFSKKAAVIGVDSQFEATPNPLNNIVTRPIYINATTGASVDLDKYNFLKFKFYETENDTTPIVVYKHFSILNNGTNKLLYVETIDQCVFDYNYASYNGSDTNFYKNPITYTSNKNECYGVKVYLAKLTPATPTTLNEGINYRRNFSRALPLLQSGATEEVIDITSNATTRGVVIYKDAREHLTFTIKLN